MLVAPTGPPGCFAHQSTTSLARPRSGVRSLYYPDHGASLDFHSCISGNRLIRRRLPCTTSRGNAVGSDPLRLRGDGSTRADPLWHQGIRASGWSRRRMAPLQAMRSPPPSSVFIRRWNYPNARSGYFSTALYLHRQPRCTEYILPKHASRLLSLRDIRRSDEAVKDSPSGLPLSHSGIPDTFAPPAPGRQQPTGIRNTHPALTTRQGPQIDVLISLTTPIVNE